MASDKTPLSLRGYAYSPLRNDHNEIRLLHVRPGVRGQPLECTLQHVSLADVPKFETISYVWGNASIRSSLILQGCAVSIPASSAAVIHRVRLEKGIRVIWIDAVCIDQTNVEERNSQVALMSMIYRGASGNIIYLGESDTAEAAVMAVTVIYQEVRDETSDLEDLHNKLWTDNGGWQYSKVALRSTVDLSALETLLSAPWFRYARMLLSQQMSPQLMLASRLWVMQEAAAATTNTCLYSSIAIELPKVLIVALWIEHKYRHLPRSLYMTDGVKNGIELWEFIDTRRGSYRQGASVGEALRIARGLQAAQAEDKVFGILGLLECLRSTTVSAIPALLQPDYRKGPLAVYRDAARYALHQSVLALDEVLGGIHHRSREELEDIHHLSWVPRWNRPQDPFLDPASVLVGHGHLSASDEKPFPGDLAAVTDHDTLLLSGILLTTAEQVAPIFDSSCHDVEHNREWQRAVLGLSNRCEYIEDDDMDKMMSMVLVAGVSSDSEPAGKFGIDAFRNCWAFLTEHGRLPEITDLTDQDLQSAQLAADFGVGFVQVCDQRRIFRTVNGRLGVGPKIMESGDIIAVLYGCQAAYVLRKYGEYHRIVGECYVYGIMQGETMREHKKLGRSDFVFSIR